VASAWSHALDVISLRKMWGLITVLCAAPAVRNSPPTGSFPSTDDAKVQARDLQDAPGVLAAIAELFT
jgi:hypothetical protein